LPSRTKSPTETPKPEDGVAFEALLNFLREHRGFDFTGYKRASLQRRIGRRMQQLELDDYGSYIDHLQASADEFEALFNTILINVTGFFRDSDAWEHLRSDVLPALLEAKRPTEAVRVWSAGTASGEEAYSIAMLVAEQLGPQAFRDRVKIYATDVDEEALTGARQAVFSERAVEGVPEDLQERYFEPANGHYAFRKDLRRSVIFGRNDLIQDAPISRVDLLVCRNTLMYFNAELQAKILKRFHFSLTERGVLFLGKAETLLSGSELFTPIDARRRFFRRLPGPPATAVYQPEVTAPRESDGSLAALALQAAPQAALAGGADGLLHTANGSARSLFGLTDADLGRPFRELDVSVRPVDVRPLLDRVSRESTTAAVTGVEWPRGESSCYLDVTVAPLAAQSSAVAIYYADVTPTHRLQSDLSYAHKQLETSYEELQSTVEELETTNEELQSTVEELETTNEELQSTNEELETTNEELQSANDELQSANEELAERSAEVGASNSFMDTILRSLDAAVIAVDLDGMVTAWSAQAQNLWGLRPDEAVGQHLTNLDVGIPVDELQPVVRRVLTGASMQHQLEMDVVNRRGKSIRTRVRVTPLSGAEGDRSGALLFMEDGKIAAAKPEQFTGA
jgi:two-component system CheB/CheR fusion protein